MGLMVGASFASERLGQLHVVDALVNEIASRASTEHQPWTLIETHNGTCRGPYSVYQSSYRVGGVVRCYDAPEKPPPPPPPPRTPRRR